ncbi:MAG: cysteine desulfurase, partial [Candidatus Muirbacterium halophilum]|nr:cysteine desulfurase [Candidatus Muirbacterium halophilum]
KAEPGQIYFTSGASEANNLIIKSTTTCGAMCTSCNTGNQPHIITTAIEHPSVLNTCKCVEGNGAKITYLKVDEKGMIDLEELKKSIRPETRLISILFANNEIGTIQKIKEIGQIAKDKNIPFHTDSVQVFGKEFIDVDELNIDFLTFSGHKFNALKGTGGLYMRKKGTVCPLIHGGHQEGMLRAGTENSVGIISMGAALNHHIQNIGRWKEIKKMRDSLEEYILKNIPHTYVNGNIDSRLDNTSNISFDFVEGEAILLRLNYYGIYVSTGSACNSDSLDPSHVLIALGKRIELAHSSVRFSLGIQNTWEEIEYAKPKIKEVIEKLRMLSPLYKN